MLKSIIKFFLEKKLITALVTLGLVLWGISTAPFNWKTSLLPRDPVAVDAIPDLGDNQQIVFAEWPGHSPQDVEDQITYPLTSYLLGLPGVKSVRSSSMFGVSSIYLIFQESVEFYWSRSRILERLNSLPAGTLPPEVQPALGPDATALGQIFWYTLEGRDPQGNPSGGWDPQELRSVQDFYLKYGLSATEGVAEVASIGGFVKEYQVEIDPVAMQSYQVNVADIIRAVKKSNLDVGARTIEFNQAEYLVRSLGYIKDIADLEEAVILARDNVPVRIKDVARVQMGPASRRGGLDKEGIEAVGAVVVARYGANPLQVIQNLKDKIEELSKGLPVKTLADGTESKVTVVPFYDRSLLINETLGTLEHALSLEILISILVVLILILNIRASLLISSLLPIGVLMTFIVMRYFNVAANIVALSGIAIAIGVMVDVAVVITENIVRTLQVPDNRNLPKIEKRQLVLRSTMEVAPAVVTALATTVISFLPVFALQGQEGKLFTPLALTKTFALIAALFIGLVIIPALAHSLFTPSPFFQRLKKPGTYAMLAAGFLLLFIIPWAGLALIAVGLNLIFQDRYPERFKRWVPFITLGIAVLTVLYLLSATWLPVGAGHSGLINFLFALLIVATILGTLFLIIPYYEIILRYCLTHRNIFLWMPLLLILWALLTWQGFDKLFNPLAQTAKFINVELKGTSWWRSMDGAFPGLGSEFMPTLDEGSYLLMPSNMPHSGVQENLNTIQLLDRRISAIPEIDLAIGKWGRAATALDPAPVSMFENIVNYKSEYLLDSSGQPMRFKVNKQGEFLLADGETYRREDNTLKAFNVSRLVPDDRGNYFRQWREHITSKEDIWDEIVKQANVPGMTSAPKLQPIATRLIMLSTGMRAPMGLKIFGPDLNTLEATGLEFESLLKQVPGIKPSSVFADRVVGKPYLEVKLNRKAIARYGSSVEDIQGYLGAIVGGAHQTTTVEGRERYAVRVRYAREYRDNPDDLKNILIPTGNGSQVPLHELADIGYERGPQNIKSENTFLVSYVIFDKLEGYAEANVIEGAREFLESKIATGDLTLPSGVSYQFAGNYENQLRAAKRLAVVVPLSLVAILLLLYFLFGRLSLTLMVFTGVFVAFAGGFLLIWLYGQDWFMNIDFLGENLRNLFNIKPINLSVAVWVGFIALFGIATDNGVLMATYLEQSVRERAPKTKVAVEEAVIEAGLLRIRPAIMTTATTLIALLPIFTSTGKGAGIMAPMAVPIFGGMLTQVLTVFLVPVLYAMWQERKLKN